MATMSTGPAATSAARNLLRDIALVKEHLHTIPLLFGSKEWHLRQKKNIQRPFTELWPLYYPVEYARIICQTLLTLPFVILVRIDLNLADYPLAISVRTVKSCAAILTWFMRHRRICT